MVRTARMAKARSGDVIPVRLAEQIRAQISEYVKGIEVPAGLDEIVEPDMESGWTDHMFEVKVDAPELRQTEIRNDLYEILDRVLSELSDKDKHYRGLIGLWVTKTPASDLF